jgi:hypothetical protein
MEKYGRPGKAIDDSIRRMRIAYWIIKTTHTEYIRVIVFPRTQWLGEGVSMLC